MKHTLRSLMFVVTLVCVVLGGRIEYLRRMAVVHEREAERIISDRVAKGWKRESLISVVDSMWSAFDGHPYSDLGVHRALPLDFGHGTDSGERP